MVGQQAVNLQVTMALHGREENSQISDVHATHPSFPPVSTQSEEPISGPEDEAATTSCQVSLFIVRKYPCKSANPKAGAQGRKLQLRLPKSPTKFPGPFLHHLQFLLK